MGRQAGLASVKDVQRDHIALHPNRPGEARVCEVGLGTLPFGSSVRALLGSSGSESKHRQSEREREREREAGGKGRHVSGVMWVGVR